MTGFLQRLALRATGRISPIRSVSGAICFPPQLKVDDAGGQSSAVTALPESTPESMPAHADSMRNGSRAEIPSRQFKMGRKGDAWAGAADDDSIPDQLRAAQVERIPETVEDPQRKINKSRQLYGDDADTRVRIGEQQQREHTIQLPAELVESETGRNDEQPVVAFEVRPESFITQHRQSLADHRQAEWGSVHEIPPLLPLQNEINEPENQAAGRRNALSGPASQTVPASVEETTEVHVSIGRIDVTAVYESSQGKREKEAQPQRPSPMSLDEYLARRHGRSS